MRLVNIIKLKLKFIIYKLFQQIDESPLQEIRFRTGRLR